MVLHNSDALSLRQMQRFSDDNDDTLSWDFMILDEVSLQTALLHQLLLLRCFREDLILFVLVST